MTLLVVMNGAKIIKKSTVLLIRYIEYLVKQKLTVDLTNAECLLPMFLLQPCQMQKLSPSYVSHLRFFNLSGWLK